VSYVERLRQLQMRAWSAQDRPRAEIWDGGEHRYRFDERLGVENRHCPGPLHRNRAPCGEQPDWPGERAEGGFHCR
jgi:hypothetical protein